MPTAPRFRAAAWHFGLDLTLETMRNRQSQPQISTYIKKACVKPVAGARVVPDLLVNVWPATPPLRGAKTPLISNRSGGFVSTHAIILMS